MLTGIDEFREYFIKASASIGISVSESEISKFFDYKDLLISWNKKMNLTSITEDEEIILKHFVDSLTVAPFIGKNETVIDIGTGAGFPGLPIKIVSPDIKLTLLDSLNKRIVFLSEVADKLCLNNVNIFHKRAEIAGKERAHRERYGICVSRAVAPLNVLAEYCMPFVEPGGTFLAMKGGQPQEEIEAAERAVSLLGGKISSVQHLTISAPGIEDNLRSIIEISKVKKTPASYPRREGIPSVKPL